MRALLVGAAGLFLGTGALYVLWLAMKLSEAANGDLALSAPSRPITYTYCLDCEATRVATSSGSCGTCGSDSTLKPGARKVWSVQRNKFYRRTA